MNYYLVSFVFFISAGVFSHLSFCDEPHFFSVLEFSVCDSIADVVTGDFNNDGIPDLVIAGGRFPSTCDSFTVHLGLGNGEFGPAIGNNLSGTGVFSILVLDLDSNSYQDLALVNSNTRSVFLFSGNGDGTFSIAGELQSEESELVAAVAEDFNLDGFLDFAIATNGFSHFVKIYFGQPGGAFSSPEMLKMDILGFFNVMASSDFNLDGVPDLIVGASLSAKILLGIGDGQFQEPIELDHSFTPSDIVIADFDGDGASDLAFSNDTLHPINLEVLMGTGIETELFETPILYSTGGERSEALTVDDVNGDGVLDLLVSNRNSDDISVMFGHGDGTFMVGPNVPTYVGPRSFASSDFNQDGKPDLAVACGDSDEIVIVLGDGTANFSLLGLDAGNSESTSEARPYSVASGDFNNDGFLDLVTANAGTGTASSTLSILINKGNEDFYPQTIVSQFDRGDPVTSVQTADFNSDGFLDIAAIIRSESSVRVLMGRGDGSFDPAVSIAIDGEQPWSLVATDLNGDSIPDIATANVASDDVSFLIGLGNGAFLPMESLPLSNGPVEIRCGDFNNDDIEDLVVTNVHSNLVHTLIGNGSGGFEDLVCDEITNISSGFTVSDFDKDGNLDLAVAENPNQIVILKGLGNGHFSRSHCIDTPDQIGELQVVDMNLDGATDLVALMSNSQDKFVLLLGDGSGGFEIERSYPCGSMPRDLITDDFNNDGFADVVTANSFSFDVTVLFNRFEKSEPLIGDINCDGNVDLLDIGPFVILIVSLQFQAEADINGDGLVNLLDVGAFIDLLQP